MWDLPSGSCVDYFSFPSPVTSLDLSPAGDFLATAHVEDLGNEVYRYLPRNVADPQHVEADPQHVKADPQLIEMDLHTMNWLHNTMKRI